MEKDKLVVKWNDNLQERLQTSFGELREHNDFTDVTLACEDQMLKAHKVILSASSPFFSGLLRANPHPQPLVMRVGVFDISKSRCVKFLSCFYDEISTSFVDI